MIIQSLHWTIEDRLQPCINITNQSVRSLQHKLRSKSSTLCKTDKARNNCLMWHLRNLLWTKEGWRNRQLKIKMYSLSLLSIHWGSLRYRSSGMNNLYYWSRNHRSIKTVTKGHLCICQMALKRPCLTWINKQTYHSATWVNWPHQVTLSRMCSSSGQTVTHKSTSSHPIIKVSCRQLKTHMICNRR